MYYGLNPIKLNELSSSVTKYARPSQQSHTKEPTNALTLKEKKYKETRFYDTLVQYNSENFSSIWYGFGYKIHKNKIIVARVAGWLCISGVRIYLSIAISMYLLILKQLNHVFNSHSIARSLEVWVITIKNDRTSIWNVCSSSATEVNMNNNKIV